MSKTHPTSVPFLASCLMAVLALAPAARGGDALAPTALVSATPSGQLQAGFARDPQISADGRYVVFWSNAPDLVPGDLNGTYDVFLRDTVAGTTELISVASGGGPCNGPSILPSISADGRYVCFDSASTNLVSPAATGLFAIYVRDRLLGTTELVSRASGVDGAQADNTTEFSMISGDGRWVAFCSYAGNLTPQKPGMNFVRDLFLRDRLTHATTLVSRGPGGVLANSFSWRPSVSHDGARIAFRSQASNLVAGGTTPGRLHVYLHERIPDVTSLLSAGAGGVEGNADSRDPQISGNGVFVAFETSATNLVPTPPFSGVSVLRDLTTGTFDPVNLDSFGVVLGLGSTAPTVSGDGRYVAFQSGPIVPNAAGQLFVRDRVAGKTFAVCSTDAGDGVSTGSGLGARLSADGTTLTFASTGNLVAGVVAGEGVYLRGLGAPLVYCLPKSNSLGCAPRIGCSGEARVSNGFDLTLTGTQALNNVIGLLIHGTTGPAQLPFAGGFLCVAPPFFRSQAVFSGGTPPPADDCSGTWTLKLGDVLALSPLGPSIAPGSVLELQWWGRDTGFTAPNNAQLSDALQVFVAP